MNEQRNISYIISLLKDFNHSSSNWIIEYVLEVLQLFNLKDIYTGKHSINVGRYAYEIASRMHLEKEEQMKILIAGVLHDVGKLFIPNSILNKKAALTAEEFSLIKFHSRIGYEVTLLFKELSDLGVPELILYHHERMDGRGYPNGMNGDKIPLGAKIISVADSYDAMTTNRIYRSRLEHRIAVEELISNSNAQFDRNAIYSIFLFFKEKGYFLQKSKHLIWNT